MVVDNICHTLNNFLRCSTYENIVFCWVMHEQTIIDRIVDALDISHCEVRIVSLTCSETTLQQRLKADVARGLRSVDVIERSVERLPLYEYLNTIKITTDNRAIEDVASDIIGREKVEGS